VNSQSLDRSLVSGIAWTGGTKWATQILSWAATLVVARILSPADYGLMGMATVYLGLVLLINEFGLTTAILR
jgi:O-antigen/teichoic acid export membrane protein